MQAPILDDIKRKFECDQVNSICNQTVNDQDDNTGKDGSYLR